MDRVVSAQELAADREYQQHILVFVSRTFALTIPQLPAGLAEAVTTAYLLCRLADTIEDEPALPAADKVSLLRQFSAVVAGRGDAERFSVELSARLSERTPVHERDLVQNLARVVRAAHRLEPREQTAMQRCVERMCIGMHYFQRNASLRGLERLSELDSYCYHVAGVVGEMLTDLFCARYADIEQHAAQLRYLAPSFGQGLQMTNILKDIWEDRARGACWLPRDIFERHGLPLEQLGQRRTETAFRDGLHELIGIAHGHLRNALAFTLLIPARYTGIRRFCLWSIGLALLTLRSIQDNPQFTAGAQVKVSRRAVAAVTSISNLSARSDWLLKRLFALAARGLPLIEQTHLPEPRLLHAPLLQHLAAMDVPPDTARSAQRG